MKFIELLNKIDSKTLFNYQIARLSEWERKPETEAQYEKALNNFVKKLKIIKAIKLIEGKDAERLVVANVKELGMNNSKYESFMMNGDGERYGIIASSWGELLNMKILQKSIELYGETDVVAQIFWDMTFLGLSENQHKKECDKLGESLSEVENSPKDNLMNFENFQKVFYGENYKPQKKNEKEEAELKEKMCMDWAESEKLYTMLNECVIKETKISN